MIAKESSNSVEVNCSVQLVPSAVNMSGSSNSISDADANNERVGLGNVFKQFFKCVSCALEIEWFPRSGVAFHS